MSPIPHEEPEQSVSASPETAPSAQGGEAPNHDNGKVSGAPVFVYLAIMLAAAFLLLLMAYLMQEHSSQSLIADLQQSLNTSRDSLTEENETLRAEVESLLGQVDALQEQLDVSESSYLALEGQARAVSEAQTALLTLERLEYLVSTQQEEPARQQLDASLREALAAISAPTAPGQPTPVERYDALEAALSPPAEESPSQPG